MKIDETILKLQKRLEIELDNSDPTKKGCFGTLAFTEGDPVCLNCTDYENCAKTAKKNRRTHLEVIEEELSRIDEKYSIERYSATDEGLVAEFDWVQIVVAFAKTKPQSFNDAMATYFKTLEENPDIDTHGKHKIFVINAESYVERILDGLQDQGYIIWDIEHENSILWKKA